MIRAIIVDDEKSSRATLSWLLETYCPEVELVGMADGIDPGLALVKDQKPDLLFLDIDLTSGTGFDLLEKVGDKEFEVIFVTAYHEYATKAFEFSALHYLLKPVNPDKLKDAVGRIDKKTKSHSIEKFEALVANLKSTTGQLQKLMIPTQDGFELVDVQDVIYCESDGSYTRLFLTDRKIMASKTLGGFEELLAGHNFFRIHRGHLINLRLVIKYTRGRGGFVTMKNGVELEVSRYKKEELLALLR